MTLGLVKSLIEKILQDPRSIRGAVAKRSFGLGARLPGLHELRWKVTSREDVFTDIYRSQGWGSDESGSGTGSELRATGDVRERLPELMERLGVQTMLDAPCGDWNWMQYVGLPVQKYYGVDIVSEVVDGLSDRFGDDRHEFTAADLTCDPLPRADAVLCRDCLVHVSFQDCARILENFRSTGATWLMLNTYPEIQQNRNQFTGRQWRRLNFQLAPFNFPKPLEEISDGGDVDPSMLGLWRLRDLPAMRTDIADS